MNFTRISHWSEVSDCGRYTVSAAVTGKTGEPKRYVFQAWRRAEPGTDGPPTLLHTCMSAEECRQRCRADARAAA